MANPITNAETLDASVQVAIGTALRGRIEAISGEDLLRISVTKRSTGRLLVFNDSYDAELYYLQGRLIAAVSGSSHGKEVLKCVLEMVDGEFEFANGIQIAKEQHDPNLNDALTLALRGKVAEPSPPDVARDASATVKTSGVHRVQGETRNVPPPPPAMMTPALSARLADIERLLIEEVGPGGKSMLERVLSKTPRSNRPVSEWLLALRNGILATVADPGARVTIITSYLFTPPE
jgi:hypothetical protein